MIKRERLSKFLICIIISVGFLHTSEMQSAYSSYRLFSESTSVLTPDPVIKVNSFSKEVAQLNESLKELLTRRDYIRSRLIVERIIKIIKDNKIDEKTISDSYYFIGVYYSFTKNLDKSIIFLKESISLREKNHDVDYRYASGLYNLGVVYSMLGDFKKHEDFSKKSLEVEKKLFGNTSPALISTYSSLITAYLQLQEYEKAIDYSNIALTIGSNNPDSVPESVMADLYSNLGVCYNRLADFSKAIIFFDRSESIYRNKHLALSENYINMMNNLAASYSAMKFSEKSDEYYEKGITPALFSNSPLAYNIINSYSIILGNKGKQQKGESLLKGVLERAKKESGEDSRNYIEVLNNYADYLREYNIDNNKSLECYKKCLDYLRKNPEDNILKTLVLVGYSLSLDKAGRTKEALETIQSLLFSEDEELHGNYDNPALEAIKYDRTSLRVLKAKYKIICGIYKKSPDLKTLEAASNTVELIVSLLEKVRINISEEDSRLILGDRFRDSYLSAISDFNLLYKKTNDRKYLEKAFEYSEKSKVAGLLTSTRELKASQFHIPSDLSELEKKLQRDIGLFNARITKETSDKEPDTLLISKWKENLLSATRQRDSMIVIFEKRYPDYYAFKYNTQVTKLKDIPSIVGRNENYINYVVSDTTLYIFIANRKNQQLLAFPVDSAFFNNIIQFRNLLVMPSSSVNAKTAFEMFKSIGSELNKTLIDPVRPYLISDKLLISPDNILSFLPFETIPTSSDTEGRILYKKLTYLMDDFDISYTYSATFMAEAENRDYSTGNKLIAFAPGYPDPINIKSVLMSRQAEMGELVDLPYARQEAKFVSDITGGKLYLNNEATESVYKAESGKYDIIHLAMHTLLNDKDPMHSTLIFSQKNNGIEDGYLKTYEIYGIPLKAKMVVLSSCNTGTGLLFSGEGILSLARGFIYSGSQSVVMSMWEIEDRSGTEIVELFYRNLKKGYSKSVALRNARIAFLKDADQLRSHPYFWSALVVYGNNSALYYSKYTVFAFVSGFLVIIGSVGLYLRRRRYS